MNLEKETANDWIKSTGIANLTDLHNTKRFEFSVEMQCHLKTEVSSITKFSSIKLHFA